VRIWNAWKPNLRKTKLILEQAAVAADVAPPPASPTIKFHVTGEEKTDPEELVAEDAGTEKNPPVDPTRDSST